MQEDRQLRRWTRSTLRVSTVYDWGSTCSLGEAINRAANVVLGCKSSNPMCWAFTSRYFVRQMFEKGIGPERWDQVLTFIFSSDVNHHDDVNGEGFESHLQNLWVKKVHPELDDAAREVEWIRQQGSSAEYEEEVKRRDEIFNVAINDADEAVATMKEMYEMFHAGGRLQRCCTKDCNELRKRALKRRQCKGLRFVPTPRERQKYSINGKGWMQFRERWIKFISKWDETVEKASEEFAFPVLPELANMVFHDMVTGYAAPNCMRRRGAKCTSEEGTTIVHPGEMGATVSNGCQLLKFKGSALDMHGIEREWSSAADEFARYALARCDLVQTSKMKFQKAVEDWTSRNVKWDRCPKNLSDWKVDGDADEFRTVDDIKLVLLRQAINAGRGVEIFIARNTEGSVFGGFLEKEPDGIGPTPNEKVMVVDCPLRLKVFVYECDERDSEGKLQVIRDKWGTREIYEECIEFSDKWIIKSVRMTGAPSTFALNTLGFEGQTYKVSTYPKSSTLERTLEIA
ncbi:hypothetical protein FGB62_108g10 [Gracilaria domingensis]|nr:hypothetical protein FGB62_108g10 [Gracilaria domingensis]